MKWIFFTIATLAPIFGYSVDYIFVEPTPPNVFETNFMGISYAMSWAGFWSVLGFATMEWAPPDMNERL